MYIFCAYWIQNMNTKIPKSKIWSQILASLKLQAGYPHMPDVFFFFSFGVLFSKYFACVFLGATSFFNILINVSNYWVLLVVVSWHEWNICMNLFFFQEDSNFSYTWASVFEFFSTNVIWAKRSYWAIIFTHYFCVFIAMCYKAISSHRPKCSPWLNI